MPSHTGFVGVTLSVVAVIDGRKKKDNMRETKSARGALKCNQAYQITHNKIEFD
jgi:hypothetical protein